MKPGRHNLEGIVLNRLNYGEADLIVAFFTREAGKVKGLAKHGRKSRKRFGNLLTPSTVSQLKFTISAGRDLARLEEGELVRSFDGLGGDVKLLAFAGLAMELVDCFYQAYDAAPEVYDLLVWCLDRLDRKKDPEETLFIFQIRLLNLSGFGPNLASCGVCGRPPEPDRSAGLSPDQGGLACRGCAAGGFPVSQGTVKIMALAQTLALDKVDRVRIGEAALKEAGPFLPVYIRRILGKDLKSLRFLEQLDSV